MDGSSAEGWWLQDITEPMKNMSGRLSSFDDWTPYIEDHIILSEN